MTSDSIGDVEMPKGGLSTDKTGIENGISGIFVFSELWECKSKFSPPGNSSKYSDPGWDAICLVLPLGTNC